MKHVGTMEVVSLYRLGFAAGHRYGMSHSKWQIKGDWWVQDDNQPYAYNQGFNDGYREALGKAACAGVQSRSRGLGGSPAARSPVKVGR